MERVIIGFDQDELGDWRAILACGHRQHVRHNPPLVNRPWVLTEEGRGRFLGAVLACKACDEGEPVSDGMVSPDALEAVYQQFRADLLRFIGQRVADASTVEDILHDVTRRVHAQASDLGVNDRLASWLYHLISEALDDREARPQGDDGDAPAALADAVRGLLDCLPGTYRQALIMADYLGLSSPEMAARLDISASEAEARVRRGREMIREALLDWCRWVDEQSPDTFSTA